MSKNPPQSLPLNSETHGWLVDAITKAGGEFLAGDNKGNIQFKRDGVAYDVSVVQPTGPLRDLSGKNKVIKAKEPTPEPEAE